MSQYRRRQFLIAAGALLTAPFPSVAQQRGKIWRVGYLLNYRRAPRELMEKFYGHYLQMLRDVGYVEGKNLVVEWRFSDNKTEALPALAAELVKLKVDVIITEGTPATLAAQKATTTIPIVMMVGDPVGAGLVSSLARPGGNTTGVSALEVDIGPKLLELLLAVAPRISKVALLINPSNSSLLRMPKLVGAEALRVGKGLLVVEARTREEIENGFAVMARQGIGAVIVAFDQLFVARRSEIAELATKNRLLSIASNTVFAESGLLLSYGATKFDLVINLKTAKALGITIPQSLLSRADRVIK